MNEQECLARMKAPGDRKPGKYREGVIQVHLTRACNLACFNCTQGSNLAGKSTFMSVEQFDRACQSLSGWWGVVGIFGGCPTMHPQFNEICEVFRARFPDKDQRGLWANHPLGKGKICRETFSTRHSNLNVHLDREAYDEFKRDWPECHPVGLDTDSRHSPVFVAMRDVLKKTCGWCSGTGQVETEERGEPCPKCDGTGQVYDEARAWQLISACDINQNWSAMIGVFRGELRAWFCEIAGAQSILHQDDSDYPDTGVIVNLKSATRWWQLPMESFVYQVRKHCHECGVPLRGYGELAQASDTLAKEQTSETHASIYRTKRKGRSVELVTVAAQLGPRLDCTTRYLQNSRK